MAFDPDDPVSQKMKNALGDDIWIVIASEWQLFYRWMRETGKDLAAEDGLSEGVSENYVRRLDQIHRALWQEFGCEPDLITPDYASAFVDLLEGDEFRKRNGEPYGGNSKRKFVNTIQKYATWKASEFEEEEWQNWEPRETFGQSDYKSSDTFTLEEFGLLTEAAKTLNELPDYDQVSPERRDKINAQLAQRFHLPKSCIGPEDWDHEENRSKIPSLVMTAQDLGLPPIEIHRANTDWIGFDQGVLNIPDEQASKQRESTELSLSQPALEELKRWVEEREQYEKYDDSNALWLNERGNRYQSRTLNDLLEKLCEEAGIDRRERKITWYSIRRTSGTYLKEYDSLEMAGDILRHKDLDTTREHYSEMVREVQRTSVSGVRELGQARASGELSEKEAAQILSGDASVLLELVKKMNSDTRSAL